MAAFGVNNCFPAEEARVVFFDWCNRQESGQEDWLTDSPAKD
jgi:hypothetical protein